MWKLNQLFVIAICLVYTEAGFTFDATPGQIQTCTGGHLSLKCTLNDPQNGTGLVQLISLSIYKTENGARKEDLASIDAFSNGKVHTKPSLTATAVGNISSTAFSYLLLDYPAPQAGVTGDFECEAHGTNFFGHPVVLTSATSVNDVTPPGSPGVSPTEDLSVLTEFQFLKDKEQNKVRGYFGQYKFINSSVFMGHTYLVSAKHLPYDVAWSQCAKYGGYLVEINSKVEHEFISNFMDSVDNQLSSYLRYFVTGGYYNGTDFTFLHHPEDNMYLDWDPGEPNYGDDYYCLSLGKRQQWKFTDTLCEATDVSTLCEVPASV